MSSTWDEAEVYARLRRTAALAFAGATFSAGAAGFAIGEALGASPAFTTKAIAVPAILAAVALPSLPDHGLPRLGTANGVTLFRSVLISVCAAFLGERALLASPGGDWLAWPLLAATSLAFWLDWVDGKIARATGEASPFGAKLDMELDAITVLVMCGLAWQLDRTGPWVLAAGALRYLFVAASWGLPWLTRPLFATNRRRFACGMQVTCLIGTLVPWPVPDLAAAIAAFGLAVLVWSFAIDIRWLWQRRNDR